MAGDIYDDTCYFKNLYVTFVHFIQPKQVCRLIKE